MSTFTLSANPVDAHKTLAGPVWMQVKALCMAGHRVDVTVKQQKRSGEQNKRLWAMLSQISTQVDWYGQKLTSEEWKDVFSSAMKRTKVVPGLDGGFVICGQSTSRMTVSEMSEMQTLMEAFGADKGVVFSEPYVDPDTGEILQVTRKKRSETA